MGEGANRFFSVGSILPCPAPPSSRGPCSSGSGSGAGQPQSARHPRYSRSRGPWSDPPTDSLSSPSPGSLCGRPPESQAAASFRSEVSPHSVPSRDSVSGSGPCPYPGPPPPPFCAQRAPSPSLTPFRQVT